VALLPFVTVPTINEQTQQEIGDMPQIRQSITDHVKFTQVLAPLVQAAATVATAYVDMRDYDFVDFVIDVGVNTNNTVDAKARECTVSSAGSPSDIAGAAITQIPGGASGTIKKVISVRKDTMTKRYALVSVTIGAGVSGAAIAITAVQYRKAGYEPVVQDANTTEVVKV